MTTVHTSSNQSLPLLARGKVRDNYAVGNDRILMVASDRISAFDVIMGEPIPAGGVPIYTDARLYSAAGIPTVLYGAGPHSLLEANGHRADERLVLEDLRKATQVVALTLMELLS